MDSVLTAPVRRFLDVGEAAEYLGLAKSTLYTMVSQRRIPFFKIGSLTKFDRLELDKWIDGHSVKVRRLFTTSDT